MGNLFSVAQTSESAVSRISKSAKVCGWQRVADLEVGETAGLETCAPRGQPDAKQMPEGERELAGAVRGIRRVSSRWLFREVASTYAELALNLLMGPLLFYLHTRFVLEILSGGHVVWKNQSRNPAERVSWTSAARVFWLPSLFGLLGLAAAWRVGFPLAVFILPVTVSWLLAIPLAVLTSDPTLGTWLAKVGLFPDALTAEEVEHLGPLVAGTMTNTENPAAKPAGCLGWLRCCLHRRAA